MAKKKKKHGTLHFILCFILFLTILSVAGIWYLNQRNLNVQYTSAALTQTTDALSNPYCGWYHTYEYVITNDSVFDSDSVKTAIETDNSTSLCLVKINLGAYTGVSLSANAISDVEAILTAWSTSGKQIILRFCYDSSNGAVANEPADISMIYLHMEQLAPVIKQYISHIYVIQGAFIGSNGLYTGSNYLADGSMADLTNYWGSLLGFSGYMSVPTASDYMTVNSLSSLPAPLSASNPLDADKLSQMSYRLGISNDSITSLADENTLTGISTISTWAPVGGSVANDTGFYDLATAITALKGWHISYLNADADASVISQWKSLTYRGDDIFDGVTGYDYMTTHLGYRYVITATSLDFYQWQDEEAHFSVSLQNIGFSTCYHTYDVTLMLRNTATEELITIPLDTDTTTWYPDETITLTTDLPVRDYAKGTYNVYLMISDSASGSVIKLGNETPLTSYGYQIATMKCGKIE